jgi:hypothetical protein
MSETNDTENKQTKYLTVNQIEKNHFTHTADC